MSSRVSVMSELAGCGNGHACAPKETRKCFRRVCLIQLAGCYSFGFHAPDHGARSTTQMLQRT
jgi:hypothetical protein